MTDKELTEGEENLIFFLRYYKELKPRLRDIDEVIADLVKEQKDKV